MHWQLLTKHTASAAGGLDCIAPRTWSWLCGVTTCSNDNCRLMCMPDSPAGALGAVGGACDARRVATLANRASTPLRARPRDSWTWVMHHASATAVGQHASPKHAPPVHMDTAPPVGQLVQWIPCTAVREPCQAEGGAICSCSRTSQQLSYAVHCVVAHDSSV